MPNMDWRRRQALTIAAQLPESRADALLVLQHARELVESFMGAPLPLHPPQAEGVVLAFPEASGASFKAS